MRTIDQNDHEVNYPARDHEAIRCGQCGFARVNHMNMYNFFVW